MSESDVLENKQLPSADLTEKTLNLFMLIRKSPQGGIVAVLTDDSIDRDEERIAPAFILRAANEPGVLPMLYDHVNSMMNLIGGWKDKHVSTSADGSHTALEATPAFFKNDVTAQVMKNKVEEAAEMGLGVGVSISARALASSIVEIGGKKIKQYDDLELLNAVLIPTQSNRNALFRISKSYDAWTKKEPASSGTIKSAGEKQMDNQTIDGVAPAANPIDKGAVPAANVAKASEIDELLKKFEERINKSIDTKVAELQSKFNDMVKQELDKAASDRTPLRKSVQDGDQTATLNKEAEDSLKKGLVSILPTTKGEGI